MMADKFSPFRMPDLRSRPEGKSKSLKDAYVALRSNGFPDRDLFIYPQGEFDNFKGEILDQRPDPGDIVSSGHRVILVAAVRGICELMPDLFTDHREDFFQEEFNPRGGAKRLFSVFDSAFLKMLCRLEWIRDIYAGIYSSDEMADYIGVLLRLPERQMSQIPREVLGFVLPRLYRYLGTEEAMRLYIETVMGIKSDAKAAGWQVFPLPGDRRNSLGGKGQLGTDFLLGDNFKSAKPALDIHLLLEDLAAVRSVIPGSEGSRLLRKMLEFTIPNEIERYSVSLHPNPDNVSFESGASFLGYSTVLHKSREQMV
jgi:hypothetical protein